MTGIAELDAAGKKSDSRLYFHLLEQVKPENAQLRQQSINRLRKLGLSEADAIASLEQ